MRSPNKSLDLNYFGKNLIVVLPEGTLRVAIEMFKLTQVGLELVSLCEATPDDHYLNPVAKALRRKGLEVKIMVE